MSLSSPEPALHHNIVGRITEKGLFPAPTEGPFEKQTDKLTALAITVFFIGLLSIQYLFKEK